MKRVAAGLGLVVCFVGWVACIVLTYKIGAFYVTEFLQMLDIVHMAGLSIFTPSYLIGFTMVLMLTYQSTWLFLGALYCFDRLTANKPASV